MVYRLTLPASSSSTPWAAASRPSDFLNVPSFLVLSSLAPPFPMAPVCLVLRTSSTQCLVPSTSAP